MMTHLCRDTLMSEAEPTPLLHCSSTRLTPHPFTLCQHEPCPPTSAILLGHTSGLCIKPASICSQMRGTETSARERHRSAALPWGLAQQGALDLLVQLPVGGSLPVSAAFTLAGLREALGSPTYMVPSFHTHLCLSLQHQLGVDPRSTIASHNESQD